MLNANLSEFESLPPIVPITILFPRARENANYHE